MGALKDALKFMKFNDMPTMEELTSRYKRLCLVYHPDKNQNTVVMTEKFKELNRCFKLVRRAIVSNVSHADDDVEEENMYKDYQDYQDYLDDEVFKKGLRDYEKNTCAHFIWGCISVPMYALLPSSNSTPNSISTSTKLDLYFKSIQLLQKLSWSYAL